MKREFERKTIFLYPEISTLGYDQLLMTNELITNINLVVYSANDLIKTILTGGNFSFINCLPTVFMQSVCEDKSNSDDDITNVRICISGFNDIDYTENYEKIIQKYKNETSDISHLVAIYINQKATRTRFIPDPKNQFDVIIESNLENLENILVAIMLDISLYHYFLLSGDLKKRKDFNLYKYEYVCSTFSQQDQEKIYGNQFVKEQKLYLPLSLKAVKALSIRTNKDRRTQTITDLISEYANFLADIVSHKIEINESGSILNPNQHKSLLHYNQIEQIIKNNHSHNKFLIIVPDDLTDTNKEIVLPYISDNEKINPWISKDNEDIGTYQIILVSKR